MKKLVAGILAGVIMISAGAVPVPAHHTSTPKLKVHYVDANNDGICDNCGKKKGSCYVDANNDGICDYHGKNCTRCYVDANNDGICDNCSSKIPKSGNHKHGHGGHHR